jgi:hypothetical protein
VTTIESLLFHDVTATSRAHDALLAAVRRAEKVELERGDRLRAMSRELAPSMAALFGRCELLAQERLGPLGQPAYVQAAIDIRCGAKDVISLLGDALGLAPLVADSSDLAGASDPAEMTADRLRRPMRRDQASRAR